MAGKKGGIVWDKPPAELAKSLLRLGSNTLGVVSDEALDLAIDMEAYAKKNHPWKNRTSDAERGLKADVDIQLPGLTALTGFRGPTHRETTTGQFASAAAVGGTMPHITITLEHGVDYGLWLEVRWGGRYAIILPTLQAHYGEMTRRLYGSMNRAR